jgi:hypothetical protein
MMHATGAQVLHAGDPCGAVADDDAGDVAVRADLGAVRQCVGGMVINGLALTLTLQRCRQKPR